MKLKVEKKTISIRDDNDNNREVLRDILINDENKEKSDLHKYFIENREEAVYKHLSYFDVYERYFSRFRGKDINLLEIGVGYGGSLKMWKNYFSINGANVNIYGIDKKEKCKCFEDDNIKIYIGSQNDRDFLREVKKEIPKLDILIDDGSHIMEDQRITFEEMYGHIKDDGIYLCEDVYTSYWTNCNGGYKNPNSFIEYTKNLIDYLNAYSAIEGDSLEANDFTNSAYSISYYESLIVIEKRIRDSRYNSYCQQGSIGKMI
ncbi:class I SAM-dependent methyltransferase [Brachyspira pilosicoli]|uniref:class I SAM-dependent methyltransferase n=1 Tax=Brachyspira pilosicoli TaxID=52584 RepID=UPI002542C6B1|nr:class I SAM-dependent methyltransferase [Brachyspira pilosicoli]WIH81721.1 class I SAM-dependent methyltransferase [Brachyspira pilosicoli]